MFTYILLNIKQLKFIWKANIFNIWNFEYFIFLPIIFMKNLKQINDDVY